MLICHGALKSILIRSKASRSLLVFNISSHKKFLPYCKALILLVKHCLFYSYTHTYTQVSILLCIYFLLHWVFIALWGLSLAVSRSYSLFCSGAWAFHCGGVSCCRAQALGTRALVAATQGLSSFSSRAPELRLSGCSTQAQSRALELTGFSSCGA